MNTDKPLVVLLDMDGTTYNLHDPWREWYNEKWDDNLTQEMWKSWDIGNLTKAKSAFYSYLDLPGIFLNLKPFEGAVEAIKNAHDLGVVHVFATTCVTKQGAWEKMEAVQRDFPFISKKNVLVTGGTKQFFRGHLLVDDGPHNLEDFSKYTGGLTCAYTMPYNTDTKANFRIDNWSQYRYLIEAALEIHNERLRTLELYQAQLMSPSVM